MAKLSELDEDVQIHELLIQQGETTWDRSAQQLRDQYRMSYLELCRTGAVSRLQRADPNYPPNSPRVA